jgi:hypothetical protein
MSKKTSIVTVLLVSLAVSTNASAIFYGGVDFPDGAVSFADVVVDYSPEIGSNSADVRDPLEALGIPDYTSGPGIDYVSLGDGGSITLQFTDNSLTGSGNSDDDLWVFEIGGDVEDTFVEISKDNILWLDVGKVGGATSGIDIDAFGYGVLDFFSFVRLTDDTNEGQQSGAGSTVGADIDALGAISSAPPVDIPAVPVPAAFWLFGTALIGFVGVSRRRKVA